jgi:hypothetical protein
MKLQLVLLSTLLAASLFDAAPGEAKTKHIRTGPALASNAPVGQSYQSAMDECQSEYAGYRGHLSRDRYAYIEGCFNILTGKTPTAAGMNCTLRRC